MGKTLVQQEITHFLVGYQVITMPVIRAHQNQGWEDMLIIFRSLNYIIRQSSNAYYIWCAYYVLGALYNLTHLNILIITMWSGTEWNICSHFPSLTLLSCSLWVEILSFAIDVGLAKKLALVICMWVEVSIFLLGTKAVRGFMCFSSSHWSFWSLSWEECTPDPRMKTWRANLHLIQGL